MWTIIKNGILSHPVLSIALPLVIIISVAGASYSAVQKGNPADNTTKESASSSETQSCKEFVQIGTVLVEKDPAGDPEAWIQFDYTSTAKADLNCQYSITFYDGQEGVIRTIPNTEDTFQAGSGQISNGYSNTPYQAGMTARVVLL